MRRRTGLRLDPYFSGTKLEWMLAHGGRARARAGWLAFGTVDTWLVWKLTGGRVHATDPTNASRTLLFEIGKPRLGPGDAAPVRRAGALLPEVRPSCGDFGATRGVPGLPDGIPIAGIAGDQQAALFGQGCVTAGQSKNTYGTGCFMLLHTGQSRRLSRAGLLTTIACGPAGEPAYALEGSVFIAGAAIQWLRDGLRILDRAADSEAWRAAWRIRAAWCWSRPSWVSARPTGGPRRAARSWGSRAASRARTWRAPHSSRWRSRPATSSTRWRVTPASALTVLRVDGGAAANDFLMQYQADLLGVAVERPKVVETTALGAGLLAGLAVGFWRAPRELARIRGVDRIFRPRKSRAWREAGVRALDARGAHIVAG